MNANYAIELIALYPTVVNIDGNNAFDANGNKVEYDAFAVQAKVDAKSYVGKRAAEYPPMTNYIDGIVKGDQTQVQAYIDACLAVKAKYPKGA
jgi:hypothetical protein